MAEGKINLPIYSNHDIVQPQLYEFKTSSPNGVSYYPNVMRSPTALVDNFQNGTIGLVTMIIFDFLNDSSIKNRILIHILSVNIDWLTLIQNRIGALKDKLSYTNVKK